MTLALELDLDIVKMYVCTKNEIPIFSLNRYRYRIDIDRRTDSTEYITYRHTRMVIKMVHLPEIHIFVKIYIRLMVHYGIVITNL